MNKTEVICTLLELVLENNAFTFDNKFYMQKAGVAMGTACVNTFASLVLVLWEDEKVFVYNPSFASV